MHWGGGHLICQLQLFAALANSCSSPLRHACFYSKRPIVLSFLLEPTVLLFCTTVYLVPPPRHLYLHRVTCTSTASPVPPPRHLCLHRVVRSCSARRTGANRGLCFPPSTTRRRPSDAVCSPAGSASLCCRPRISGRVRWARFAGRTVLQAPGIVLRFRHDHGKLLCAPRATRLESWSFVEFCGRSYLWT